MRFLGLAVVLVACGDSGSAAPARESGRPERKANSCPDAPAVAGSEIVYCERGMGSPDMIVAGPPLVVGVSTCCAYAIAGGHITPLVTRELLGDLVIAGCWLYVANGEQTGHPAAITRVTLDGSRRETLLSLPAGSAPIALAVVGGTVYAVTAHQDGSSGMTDIRLNRIAGGKVTSTPLDKPVRTLVARGERVLLAGGHDIYEIRDLALTRLASADGTIEGLAIADNDVYVATFEAVHRLTSRNTLERVATGERIRAVAVTQTHIAWIDAAKIMAQPIAGGPAKQVATFREQLAVLAADASAVYWSVPYYYAPDAKTVEQRLQSQKAGFVARTPLR